MSNGDGANDREAIRLEFGEANVGRRPRACREHVVRTGCEQPVRVASRPLESVRSLYALATISAGAVDTTAQGCSRRFLARVSRDADDDGVLATALAAGATVIVPGDQDLLVVGRFNGDIASPRDFLSRLWSWPTSRAPDV